VPDPGETALSAPGKVGRLGRHAVVIGGSVGGLLTARVLSGHFDQVTVVERDPTPEGAEPRKGVPQGKHVHALFGGGVAVLERFYPGIFEELVAAGAVACDFAKDLRWYHQGVWKLRVESGLRSFWQTRPFLEAHVRRRTVSAPGVRCLDRCEAVRLLSDAAGARVTGVEVRHRAEAERTERLEADLVVDASGRGSRLPQWLAALGHSAPEETTVGVGIGYASRFYERRADAGRDWRVLAVFATPPGRTRSGYLFPIEGGRWLATAVGRLTDQPPGDERGYLEFVRSLEVPDFYEAIKDARPLSPVSTFTFPAQRWRRYERLARFPDGLIVLGDAVCSFNPVYGQGMSVCALQADLLDRVLRDCGGAAVPAGLSKRFLRRAAGVVATPWLIATGSDFMYPQTQGRRPFGTRLLNWYFARVFRLCARDRDVLLRFYRVLHLLDQPITLFHPSVLFRVLCDGIIPLGARARCPGCDACAF
jgi:2-polyprenyl-6-methoxyphenol hydroxylase-like FAD-dependent oxidoreductase